VRGNCRRKAGLQLSAQTLQRVNADFVFLVFRFGYVDFKDLSGAKNAFKMHGTSFQGRAIEIDTDQGKAKAGYRARGDFENHTQFNQKVNKDIKKSKEIEKATSKIKNYNPSKKSERFEEKEKQREMRRNSENAERKANAGSELNEDNADDI
jgi:hypothetical protein